MTSEHSDLDHLDAIALWRSLKSYLKVDIAVVAPESPKPESPVNVKITVTNIAPSGPDSPEIVFEGASVNHRRGGSESSRGMPGELRSGQSLSSDYDCSFQELAATDWSVEALVSRRSFFKVGQIAAVPITLTRPTILAYVRAFNSLPIYAPLETLRHSGFAPGPTTTLAQIQAFKSAVDAASQQIQDLGRQLGSLPRIGVQRQATSHMDALEKYLVQMKLVCDTLKAALTATDHEAAASATRPLATLEELAAKVDETTKSLMRNYAISNEEVGYRGRAN